MKKLKKLIYDKASQKLALSFFDEDESSLKNTDVSIEVFYSGINYKDALGVSGRGSIFKVSPIIPGIDFSGLALTGKYKGQNIIAQGCGFGESFDGGYTQKAFCDENLLVPLPSGLSLKEAMALGTAGFTAALAIHRMLQNGQSKDMGPVLVSGATGGVGAFATQILNQLGFEVHVVTHRMEHEEYLKSLGASEVLGYEKTFSGKEVRALEKSRWGGVIDNLGGEFLEKVLPQVALWGNVASIGLAKSHAFKTTVMPFILRGVSILGASSNNCSKELRNELWLKLGSEWKPKKITELVNKEVSLEEVLDSSIKILDHKSAAGRVLVDLKK